MANREALRELQNRLAIRLQAARAEGPSVSWLAIEAGGGRYLIPLAQSGEIFPWTAIHAVPYTRRWFLGVANLRGGLWGVVDLADFLGEAGVLSAQTRARTELALAECSLLALNAGLEVNVALLVDRLVGLRSPESFVSSSAPAENAPAFLSGIYTDAQGESWQEVNLLLLSQTAQFLSIGA
ncbi:MAG: chemotaxis protein CheW [Curvibacter sp.]|nr:chemotaxis protein CheW [Curvibacter sp.]